MIMVGVGGDLGQFDEVWKCVGSKGCGYEIGCGRILSLMVMRER